MNNETYMLFDSLTDEWRETSLEELAQLNDPGLQVCIYTTAAQLLQKQKPINVTVSPVSEEVAVIAPVKNFFNYLHEITSKLLTGILIIIYLSIFIALLAFFGKKNLYVLWWITLISAFAIPPAIVKLLPKLRKKTK